MICIKRYSTCSPLTVLYRDFKYCKGNGKGYAKNIIGRYLSKIAKGERAHPSLEEKLN